MFKALFSKCFRINLFQTKHQLVVNYFLFVIFIVLQAILIYLGLWQLDRQQEKAQITEQVQKMKQSEPVLLNDLVNPGDYQPVTFIAEATPLTVLIANEPYKGKDGYNVLSLIKLDDEKSVWLNRGWIEALPDRRNLPQVPDLPKQIQSQGEVYFQKGEPVLFDRALQKSSENIWLLQGFSFKYLNSIPLPGNSKLLPFIIRLDPDSEYGLVRDWQYIAMPPEKHLAYAIQWFGLALASLVIFIVTSIKKSSRNGL